MPVCRALPPKLIGTTTRAPASINSRGRTNISSKASAWFSANRRTSLISAVFAALREHAAGAQPHVRMREALDPAPVFAGPVGLVQRLVAALHKLHVLLRHRLLRQPHGLEGPPLVEKVLGLGDAAVVERVDSREAVNELNAAGAPVA